MEIFASIAIKTWRKHRHRNTLSYYQLGVGTETQEAVHETPRVRKVHPAVSTHEIYRAPPPPLPLPCQSSVLDLERLVGITGIRERNIERQQHSRDRWADGRPLD